MEKITLGRLNKLLRYDQKTGFFSWRVRRGSRKPGDRAGSPSLSGHQKSGGVTGRRLTYWTITVDGKTYVASRLAYFYMTGNWPPQTIDHKDRNSLNDAWENLRPATRSQNEANKAAYRNSSTGLKGIWPLPDGRYAARIYRDHKSNWLGVFETPDLAHSAYAAAAVEHDGQFARSA